MPLVIRELNIKVNVGPPPNEGANDRAGGGAGGGKADDAATIQRAVEELLRIDADRKER